jgi:NAD(P)H-hydrate epimerase
MPFDRLADDKNIGIRMYIVTTSQMQAAERAADASGLSYDQMMENAGHAVAQAIEERFDITDARVLILVGPGNNGGDGLVVARYLAQSGALVTVFVWQRSTEEDENWVLLDATGVEKIKSEDQAGQARLAHLLGETEIIVDALLGTGVSRPIGGSLAELLDNIKTAVLTRRTPYAQMESLIEPAFSNVDPNIGPAVVALDVPSGLNSDTGAVDPHTLSCDLTITLAAVKQGHILMPGPSVVGQLVVGNIGIGPEHYEAISLEMATAPKVAEMLPPRPVDAHKGTFGTALLVAGSVNYTGAAILAGQAAARIGTGLVTMAPPSSIHAILASRLTEATYWPLAHNDGMVAADAAVRLEEKFAGTDALLVGPGLGLADSTALFMEALLAKGSSLPPLVLDADALNILANQGEGWWGSVPPNSILTPHPGEMARLSNRTTQEVQANRLGLAGEMAEKWQQIVLLKGAHTIIAAPDGRKMVMPFANPALGKAGSGDVLAGVIVGLRAQGVAPFEAASAGAYLHGLAGELARDNLGAIAVVAGDLVGYLVMASRMVRGRRKFL